MPTQDNGKPFVASLRPRCVWSIATDSAGSMPEESIWLETQEQKRRVKAPTCFLLITHAEQTVRKSGYYMPVVRLSNSRKRRHSEPLTPQQNKTSQHISKKWKHSHLSGSQFPPAFWDNLSHIDLIKHALEELDRRNTQAALSYRPPYSRSYRPITRYRLAEWKKSFQNLTPPVEYLCHCKKSGLKNIKLTARHGGPDLSDLRGVRRTRCTQLLILTNF